MTVPAQRENTTPELDQLCINTIRTLALDAVQKANSGHPGLPLGAAPMAYVLWTRFLRHNPKNPKWANRDRFLLSAGHGSMLIYALLYLTGYDLPLDELKADRAFVRNMSRSLGARRLVQATIDFAHNFDLRAVAEGVEDHASLETLRGMGCDVIQGHVLSEALPADAFTRWLEGFASREAPQRTATTD